MNYEQKYKEALERARKLYKDAITLQLEQDIKDYEQIFPELRESKDERIREEILGFLKTNNAWNKEWIDWLEKQGEQKPEKKELKTIDWSKHIKYEPNSPSIIEQKQEWNEEDETMRKNIEGALDCYEGMAEGMVAEDWEEEKQWLKSLKDRVQPQSKIEWSEEDENMANDLIEGCLSSEKAYHLAHTSKEIADWLKSLKSKLQR